MAQYRGTVKGTRGDASRLGGKGSGLEVNGCGWDIGGSVVLHWDEREKRDIVSLFLTGGSNGHLSPVLLGRWVRDGNRYKQLD